MKFSILIILIFTLGLTAFGQTFFSNWEKVPTIFNGNDFETIYSSLLLSRKFFEKDEFETTAKFIERINNPENIDLGNNLTAANTLFFVYKPSPKDYSFANRLFSEYDADNEDLKVTIGMAFVSAYIDVATTNVRRLDFSATTVKSPTMKSEGVYNGENAFGVKRTIEKFRGNTFSLAIANIKNFREADSLNQLFPLRVSLKLPAIQAKSVKNNLAVAFTTKLIFPYYGIGSTEVKPTINEPVDITSYNQFLVGNVSEIWLFDKVSGTIYLKLTAKQIVTKKDESQQVQSVPEKAQNIKENSQEIPKKIPRTISGGVINGKAIKLVKPIYPKSAKATKASGAVNVQVELDEAGNVVSAKAVSGHPLLAEAAEEAARQSKFAITNLSGEPVRVTGVIVYNFLP